MKTPVSASSLISVMAANPTVMEELTRLNKTIESNEHALQIAKQRAARGWPVPDAALAEVKAALKQAESEFAALSLMLKRAATR